LRRRTLKIGAGIFDECLLLYSIASTASHHDWNESERCVRGFQIFHWSSSMYTNRLLLPNIVHMYSRHNCLVLQPGERWQTTARWDSVSGAETAQRLSFYEMELAVDTKNVLLVADVDFDRMRRPRYWCYRYDAQEVRNYINSSLT
jgi:hypothetical protein